MEGEDQQEKENWGSTSQYNGEQEISEEHQDENLVIISLCYKKTIIIIIIIIIIILIKVQHLEMRTLEYSFCYAVYLLSKAMILSVMNATGFEPVTLRCHCGALTK